MKQPNYLKSFEYSIPASEKDFHQRGNLYRDYFKMDLPPVKINIDFENKYLVLENNGFLTKSSSSNSERSRSDFEKKRIKVNANIYCGLDINLSGCSGDELVFLLEGIMDDGESKNPCSGLLVIDTATNIYESGGKEWDLRVYLYDNNNEDREIKLDLIMYSFSQNAELN
jgi:hypothetical protein